MVAAAPIRVTATSARAMAPTSRATPSTPKETVNTVLSVTWEGRTSGFGWGKGASSGGANRHVNRGNMGLDDGRTAWGDVRSARGGDVRREHAARQAAGRTHRAAHAGGTALCRRGS